MTSFLRSLYAHRFVLVTAGVAASAAACADAVSPGDSPDVLRPVVGAPVHDSSAASAFDTLGAGQLRGTVVVPSRDSTVAWQPLANARIEVATRDAHGAMTVVATVMSNDAGAFALRPLTVPAGLLFLRATPNSAGPYRATRWLAAYAFSGPWATTGIGTVSWKLGPYVVIERADDPVRDYAPVLLVGHVLGDDGRTGVTGAVVVVERLAQRSETENVPRVPLMSLGIVASARTDVAGQFLIQLPGTSLYGLRVTAPASSLFGDVPLTVAITTSAVHADVTTFNYARFQLGRR